MTKNFSLIIALLLSTFSINSFAQKARITSGNIDAVKAEKNISIIFNYDNMKVGKISEAEYVERKVKENNADKPGKGDNWLSKWKGDRSEVYEPAFIKYFTKASKIEVVPNAKYTLIFQTTTFEPGFNSLVERKPGFIESAVKIVETQNPSNVIATIDCGKLVSRSVVETYTVAARLEICYATAGNIIGKLFK